jgi:hypothetical protein
MLPFINSNWPIAFMLGMDRLPSSYCRNFRSRTGFGPERHRGHDQGKRRLHQATTGRFPSQAESRSHDPRVRPQVSLAHRSGSCSHFFGHRHNLSLLLYLFKLPRGESLVRPTSLIGKTVRCQLFNSRGPGSEQRFVTSRNASQETMDNPSHSRYSNPWNRRGPERSNHPPTFRFAVTTLCVHLLSLAWLEKLRAAIELPATMASGLPCTRARAKSLPKRFDATL